MEKKVSRVNGVVEGTATALETPALMCKTKLMKP
jgi:hypothetical protein